MRDEFAEVPKRRPTTNEATDARACDGSYRHTARRASDDADDDDEDDDDENDENSDLGRRPLGGIAL